MRRSSVTFTAPSVEFSTGTTPKAARSRSTSANTSAMLRAGPNCVDEPNRRVAAAGVFVPGDEVREILLPLELADLEGGASALIEEVEDLLVEVIDPGTPIVQVHRSS